MVHAIHRCNEAIEFVCFSSSTMYHHRLFVALEHSFRRGGYKSRCIAVWSFRQNELNSSSFSIRGDHNECLSSRKNAKIMKPILFMGFFLPAGRVRKRRLAFPPILFLDKTFHPGTALFTGRYDDVLLLFRSNLKGWVFLIRWSSFDHSFMKYFELHHYF